MLDINSEDYEKILIHPSNRLFELLVVNLMKTLVAAGVTADEGSVEQTSKGKQYRGGLRCFKNMVRELLKDEVSKLSGEIQQVLDILCRTGTSEPKDCSRNELGTCRVDRINFKQVSWQTSERISCLTI